MAAGGLGASKRCQGGARAAERVSQFLGTPSEAHTFPRAGSRPLLGKESDRHRPRTRCGLLDEKRGQQGQGSEARGYLADLLPSLGRCPQSAPSPSNRGDFGFFREMPWRDGVGVRRPKPRVKFRPGEGCLEMGEGQLFFPYRSPPVPTSAGEERQAPPGEVSWEGLLQEGGDSDEEIRQRPHGSGPLHRVR